MNYNCSKMWGLRNFQEQVKKAFCYQKLFWPFTDWTNCSRDLKKFANSRPSASNSKSFSGSLEHFFLTVGQNNFGNKIPFANISPSQAFCIFLEKLLLTRRAQIIFFQVRRSNVREQLLKIICRCYGEYLNTNCGVSTLQTQS